MEQSILKSTKKILGIGPDDTSFDLDVLTHINSTFSDLQQIGVGPLEGFGIEDDSVEWADYIEDDSEQLNRVKTYMYLKVRMLFDPPTTSYLLDAYTKQLEQCEWRLSVTREHTGWIDPDPVPVPSGDIFGDPIDPLEIVDGGDA